MLRTIALPTALAVFATLPANPAAAAGVAELLVEEHYSQHGYDVDLFVTEGDDGLIAEATITDPATGDAVDLFSDGVTIGWNGIVEGESSEGSMPAPEIDRPGEPPQPICFTPVTAIVCIGIVLLAACATKINACPDRDTVDPSSGIPGGGGGVPEEPGDGDGDGDGGGGKSGGGDDD